MKTKSNVYWLFTTALLLLTQPAHSQWDKLKNRILEKAESALSGSGEGWVNELLAQFEQSQPISTTFDDAVYEADFLGDFEPHENAYNPLEIQPRTPTGAFRLHSGVYSMYAKSFCLRGYTYGPSRGDGHLYAPLKGKKADFVRTILQRYSQKPQLAQNSVQVLLWAIIAGADMKSLGAQHAQTLNALFTPQELLVYQGKDWLGGVAQQELGDLKRKLVGKTPPQLQAVLDANASIRSMVAGNKSFQEIEKIAIIAGVAPRDMIREVSKGRWSYHPDGYFVRFFPNGYTRTRVDVYVPFEQEVQTNAKGHAIGMNPATGKPKEVLFDLAGMVASPANRPSQRIGPVPVPAEPCDEYMLVFYSFKAGTQVPTSASNPEKKSSVAGHMYIGFARDCSIESVKGFSPREGEGAVDEEATVDASTNERYLLGYHTRCFAVPVSRTQYYEALAATMQGYQLGFNDCVSYVDKVAELIGLATPQYDPTVFPDSYMEYLQLNNPGKGRTSHTLCNCKPIQYTPIPATRK